MPLSVWMPEGAEGDDFLEALVHALPEEVELHVGPEAPPVGDVRVLIQGVPTAEQLDACPELERVVVPYAGVPARTRTLLADRPQILLHNLHHNAAPAAELAVALMLAAVKRVVPHDRDLRAGDWHRRYGTPETTTLAGRHAVVLGYGAIGRRVARMCHGLEMTVSAVRRLPEGASYDAMATIHAPAEMRGLLPKAQVLLLCLPLTTATSGLLGAAELALLPEDACLVNVGRGALVDEQALYESLRARPLFSAGLDVWYRYPHSEAERAQTPPSAYPFHELENVVLSPHRGGLTRQNEALRAEALATLLTAVARGESVPHLVDLEQGY